MNYEKADTAQRWAMTLAAVEVIALFISAPAFILFFIGLAAFASLTTWAYHEYPVKRF